DPGIVPHRDADFGAGLLEYMQHLQTADRAALAAIVENDVRAVEMDALLAGEHHRGGNPVMHFPVDAMNEIARLAAKADAESECRIGRVLLEDHDRVLRCVQADKPREVKPGRPASDHRDAHRASPPKH